MADKTGTAQDFAAMLTGTQLDPEPQAPEAAAGETPEPEAKAPDRAHNDFLLEVLTHRKPRPSFLDVLHRQGADE